MYKYTGGGWLPGVPARDLTDAEWRELVKADPDLKHTTLYEHMDDSEHPRLAARAEKAAEAHAAVSGEG